VARLGQQRVFLNDHHPDYDRDPFFFTVSIYRYNRGGRYYETNQYGADLLRQAVNSGYEEGFRAGEADRRHCVSATPTPIRRQLRLQRLLRRVTTTTSTSAKACRGYEDGFNSRLIWPLSAHIA
jgi:hypothetical protein